MDTLIWLQGFTLAALAVIGVMLKHYVSSYLGEKAKNLATKEDVAAITDQIESVKARHAKDFETIRTSLGSRAHIHRFRYEREFAILQELMEKLVELRDATMSLRPEAEYIDPDETDDQRKKRRLARYTAASRALYLFSETRQPFFAEEILVVLRALDQVAWQEVVQYRRFSPHADDQAFDARYWDRAAENSAKIAELTDNVIRSVRERVRRWEAFDPAP